MASGLHSMLFMCKRAHRYREAGMRWWVFADAVCPIVVDTYLLYVLMGHTLLSKQTDENKLPTLHLMADSHDTPAMRHLGQSKAVFHLLVSLATASPNTRLHKVRE